VSWSALLRHPPAVQELQREVADLQRELSNQNGVLATLLAELRELRAAVAPKSGT
jgi:uncharacterized protein involved in exopolysaccharide biosynthesis